MADRDWCYAIGGLAVSGWDFPVRAVDVATCIDALVASAGQLSSRADHIARSTGDSRMRTGDSARPTAGSVASADNGGSGDGDFAPSEQNPDTRDADSAVRNGTFCRWLQELPHGRRTPSVAFHQQQPLNCKENVMRYVDSLRYEMLVRVRDFGVAHSTAFPEGTLGTQLFAEVNATVEELSQHAATEVSGRGAARKGTGAKALARQALGQKLEAINRTARALAVERPGLADKFRLPRRSGNQALLAGARAFAQDAAPLAAAFVAHAMPEGFLSELEAGISAYEQALRDHQAGKGTRLTAGADIRSTLQTGLNAVLQLDAIVANQLRDDPTTTLLWERIRRVEYPPRARRRRPRASKASAAPPLPATSTPAPAPAAPTAPGTPALAAASPATATTAPTT